jgi:allantoin racemase
VPIIEDLADCLRRRAPLPPGAVHRPARAGAGGRPRHARAACCRPKSAPRAIEDGAEAVVLGCAGMAELCDWLAAETGVPVIDGVTAAVKQAEAIVGMGYRTAKTGGYDWPRAKRGGICSEVA